MIGPEPELSAQERALRRRAAVFALTTFEDRFPIGGIELNETEMALIAKFKVDHPEPDGFSEALYPDNFMLASYRSTRQTLLHELFDLLNYGETDTNDPVYNEELKRCIEKDPSGVAIIQAMLNQVEDEAARGISVSPGTIRADAELQFAALDFYLEEKEKSRPLESRLTGDQKALLGQMGPEEKEDAMNALRDIDEIRKKLGAANYRSTITGLTGYSCDDSGNVVSVDQLHVRGCHMFYKRYCMAVNSYLINNGGSPTLFK